MRLSDWITCCLSQRVYNFGKGKTDGDAAMKMLVSAGRRKRSAVSRARSALCFQSVEYPGSECADARVFLSSQLGGKGANLAEMCSIGLSVPPGFTITTDTCNAFHDNGEEQAATLVALCGGPCEILL